MMKSIFKGLLDKVSSLYLRYYPGKALPADPGRVCMTVRAKDILIAYGIEKQNKMQLQWVETIPFTDRSNLQPLLMELSKKYQLEQKTLSWVLQPEDYQLLLTEALPTPPSEFQQAIRWKIKDMVQIPMDDAIIDSFPMPKHLSPNAQEMIMVVVSRNSLLTSINEQMRLNKLHLTTIDIPELALRNITAQNDLDEKGIALLYVHDTYSQLIITRQKLLYLTRRLEYGEQRIHTASEQAASDNNQSTTMDAFFLELQRSFDFYQTQWRLPLPTKIILVSTKSLSVQALSFLTQRIAVPIEQFDVSTVIQTEEPLSPTRVGECLPIFGELLRNENVTHATTN